jgi:hapalindole H/12-epi-hapalindole U/12-epi-fischerindole U synthase
MRVAEYSRPMKTSVKLRRLIQFVIASALGMLSEPGSAQTIPIVNAGFEADNITPGAFAVLVPQGWSVYDPGFIINQNANAVGVIRPLPGVEYFPAGTPAGVNAALVFLAGNQSAEAGLQQTLAATLQANTRYRCSVQIGNIASGTSLPGSADGGGIFYDLDGFPGYRVDVLAGTAVVASDNNSIGASIPAGQFRPARFYFDVPNGHPQLGQPLGIRLVNLKQPGTVEAPNIEVDFDEVLLSAGAIPVRAQLNLSIVGAQPVISITGTTGATYLVEHAPALPTTNWVALTNVLLTTSPQAVLDLSAAANADSRFYRALILD